MKFKIIFGLFIFVVVSSCFQQTSKNGTQTESEVDHSLPLKSGLLIENKINRGINYTDPIGADYSIRYIPISITNDSSVSIHVQIAFSKQYNYPAPHSEEQFKLIPLPGEWARDGVGVSDSMISELPTLIDNPVLAATIAPGEKIVLAIGSIYPLPAKTSGVLPRVLFTQRDTTTFAECDWLLEKDRSSNQHIPLGLKVIFGDKCRIIPCGQVTYPDQ